MKIGLLFGSFNPIHTGHLIIANHIANYEVDKVWFIVSPQNPFKQATGLLPADHRLSLTRLAVEDDNRFEVSDIEFSLPTPSYTINTLRALSKKHGQHKFCLIIGSDNYQGISAWRSSAEILNNYEILVYERPGFPIANKPIKNNNIKLLNAPLLDISSTTIRNMLGKNESIRYLVPEKVYAAIQTNSYFK